MSYNTIIVAVVLIGGGSFTLGFLYTTPISFSAVHVSAETATEQVASNDSVTTTPPETPSDTGANTDTETNTDTEEPQLPKIPPDEEDEDEVKQHTVKTTSEKNVDVFTVPFYSQFTDITSAKWKKVGCGVTSLAMLIEFYTPDVVSVDELLGEGITAGAYLNDAGWTYAGLIQISQKYGLDGESHDMGGSSMETAFEAFKKALEEGPVMASVHYTFDPKNPIPHLVIVNGVKDDMLYYNDPSEKSGGGSISISKFQKSWKKRYIEFYPVT